MSETSKIENSMWVLVTTPNINYATEQKDAELREQDRSDQNPEQHQTVSSRNQDDLPLQCGLRKTIETRLRYPIEFVYSIFDIVSGRHVDKPNNQNKQTDQDSSFLIVFQMLPTEPRMR